MTNDALVDLLARASGYLSRVETRSPEDQDRLVFARDQILTALDLLQPAPGFSPAGDLDDDPRLWTAP